MLAITTPRFPHTLLTHHINPRSVCKAGNEPAVSLRYDERVVVQQHHQHLHAGTALCALNPQYDRGTGLFYLSFGFFFLLSVWHAISKGGFCVTVLFLVHSISPYVLVSVLNKLAELPEKNTHTHTLSESLKRKNKVGPQNPEAKLKEKILQSTQWKLCSRKRKSKNDEIGIYADFTSCNQGENR